MWFPADSIEGTPAEFPVTDAGRHAGSGRVQQLRGRGGGTCGAPWRVCVMRTQPLPVPQSVLHLFQDSADAQYCDDVSKHGGRLRSFQHEQGNWATYVYVPYRPDEEFCEMLEDLVSLARKNGVVLSKMNEFHISQSQTVVLRHHWIDPFVQSLRERLRSMNRFLCVADRLRAYTNQEKTRTFLGLEVTIGKEQLLEVVSEVDKSLQEFNLETFYQNPSFHVSLAWCLGDSVERLQGACLKELQGVVDACEDSELLTRFYADEIRCKSGNKVFSIPLQ
ncbi:U6 snRNA phosphodiesterase 1 isoform X2 [Pseudophryne corroboree]